jgi:carbon-monoxide dehydrogenase small subunit
MGSVSVSTTINGDEVDYLCQVEESLLDVLRNRLGLLGAKEGCGTGDCGACSVIMDGRVVCSCLVLGAEAQGRTIETIEGMAVGNDLHPLQAKFIEHAALQCGVCTPGFLMAAKALLDANPSPTEEEIRFWLAGNLCRCTGYDKIVRAVADAALEMRGERA